MRGHAVGLAAMATSAVVLNGAERADASTSVIAFAADALILQRQGETRPPSALVDDLLSLRGKGRTDLALALRTAAKELAREPAAERLAIVLSDCRATAGDDPLSALARARPRGRARHRRGPRGGGGRPAPRLTRARAVPSRRSLQRPPIQSSGPPGLENVWSHLDE